MSKYSLAELYNHVSKHSNYQILAKSLRDIIPQDGLAIVSRYEKERLDYVLARCMVAKQVILDIGGNTGFFTLECAAQGASRVLYFEGNKAHAQFVRQAVQALNLDNVVGVTNKYLNFKDDFHCRVDLCFLLNVLHHIGDDYGDSALSLTEAKKQIIKSLSYMSAKANMLVFQMGFNWKGDRRLPLFERGTKAEMIEFVRSGTANSWEILDIGVAQKTEAGGCVEYQDLNEANLQRDDSLGEFLNRPLFIMRSKSTQMNQAEER